MTRRHPRHVAVPINEDVAMTPTPERRNQGIVERLDRPIADESGRPARPYRAVDTLAAMERRGSITAGMSQACESRAPATSSGALFWGSAASARPQAHASGMSWAWNGR